MNVRIRHAQAADYPQVEAIMKQVHALHLAWRPDIFRTCDPVLPEAEFRAALDSRTLVVAEADGAVAGLLSFVYRQGGSPHQRPRKVLFIDTLAVDEARRGQGIGRQLLDYAKALARQERCDGLELQVNARNQAAYAMYRHCGFAEKSINMELV